MLKYLKKSLLVILILNLQNILMTLSIIENKNKEIPENILQRWNEFNNTYYNDFFGQNSGGTKQHTYFTELEKIIKDENHLKIKDILDSLFIATTEKPIDVYKSLLLRVPIYYGKIVNESFEKEAFLNFRKLSFDDNPYGKEIKTFNQSHIVFPAGISPYWQWNEKEETLLEQGVCGFIFSNGVNFESTSTIDYKNFINNKEKLKEQINNIGDCLIFAAIELAKRKNTAKNYNLRIPAFGLTCFATEYTNKRELASMYLSSIKSALLKHITADTKTWYIDFFEYKDIEGYKEAFETIFTTKKINDLTTHNIHVKHWYKMLTLDPSIYNKNNCQNSSAFNDTFIIFAHAGDPYSLI